MKFYTFALWLALLSLCVGCSIEDSETETPIDTISIHCKSYVGEGKLTPEDTKISSLTGYLFVNGTLQEIFPELEKKDMNALNITSLFLNAQQGEFHFLANHVIPSIKTTNMTIEDFKSYTIAIKPFENSIPMHGKLDINNQNQPVSQKVELVRLRAKLDLLIEAKNVEISSLEFTNLYNAVAIDPASPIASGEAINSTLTYTTPLSETATICYLNEQISDNSYIDIIGKFNGIPISIHTKLPETIKRNTQYIIRLIKVGASLTANISVADWGDGGVTDATPDVESVVLIDPKGSTLSEGISISAGCDTLFIPSTISSNSILALKAEYQLNVEMSGNNQAISITPTGDYNRFNLTVNKQVAGAQAYYSHLIIKNAFFEDYYGNRIVLRIAPNNDAPIADADQLSTVDGLQNLSGIVLASPYGGNNITIPAANIKTSEGILTTISAFTLISEISSSVYKSIQLSRNGNSLILRTAPNTTGSDQAVTAIVRGNTAAGTEIAALISITSPAISPSDLEAMNRMCVTIGGNTWMQLHTTGTYAEDMKNIQAVMALPEGLSMNSVKNNFSLFGTFYDTYNVAKPCPPGFKTPTPQEFSDLFGIPRAATAEWEALKGVASKPMTTTGGMLITYLSISGSGNGRAVVKIEKDGKAMYLTNGRIVTTPSRGFFEFWHSGSFTFGVAQANSYNWARRCVKDSSYNGLN